MRSNEKKSKKSFGAVIMFAGIFAGSVCTTAAPAAQLQFSGMIHKAAVSGIYPPKTVIRTFSEEAGIRLVSSNLTRTAATLSLVVTDSRSNLIKAVVYPPEAAVDVNGSAEFLVMVPMNGKERRKFQVCAEYSGVVDFRQCGRYLAKKVD